MSKNKGQVDIVTGMFLVLIVLVVILFGFKTAQFMVTSAYVEDALVASNLASAVIDLQEYGKSHQIIINDPIKAYERFKVALCHNLQLDEFLYPTENSLLESELQISEYRIYNVRGEEVEVYVINGNGTVQEQYIGKSGEITTPDGVCVTSATIYSKVNFEVQGIGGQSIQAKKEKSVDIVRCENE